MKKELAEIIQWGYEKDQPDSRDFQAERLIFRALPLPKRYFVNPNTPVYNQGQKPSCVGWAAAGVKTDEEFLQHAREYTFDGNWLYEQCKLIDGIPNLGGTYPRVALKVLQEQGIKQTGLPCARKEANSFWQIGSYYRLANDSTDELIKQVIFQFGSVMVGSYWYSSWMDVKHVFPAADEQCGGHGYRVTGWEDDPAGYIVVNSWGKLLWGANGIAVMPYELFNQAVLKTGGDVWKLIDK